MNNGDIPKDELIADELTWREQEVLQLLAERLTNREIADQLHLAESTVKDYVGNILSKLYVKNRRQAVERAGELSSLIDSITLSKLPKSNLPAEPTPFVGRIVELNDIKQLLGETRLLTLTGPGGMGKSRLALRVAMDVASDFEHGVFFITLASINSPSHIIQTTAENLNFPMATNEDPQVQLLRYLRNKNLLLVMDNFEHMLDGVYIVTEIIKSSPEVRILATSREKLNLRSETTLVIRGMTSPDQPITGNMVDFDAIKLFVQSANKVCPGFYPSQEEVNLIAEISRTVQGMPLAIELSAAWLQLLSLREIIEELKKGIDILVTEVKDAPIRHRSIRSVFDHSWILLTAAEQEIFKKLSVFRKGFTRDAAQQVSGANLQQLVGLVNKSFLNLDPDSGRLRVHELLRQYAQEKLEESTQGPISAQEAHAGFFSEFMFDRWRQLKSDRQMIALDEIEADLENVRAAWSYYLSQGNSPQLYKFILALWFVHWIRGWNLAGMKLFSEAARASNRLETEHDLVLRALSMSFQGYFMAWLDLSDHGYEITKEAVTLLKDLKQSEPLIFAIDSLILNCYFQNRISEQLEITSEMYNLASEFGEKWLVAFTMFGVGMASLVAENYQKAREVATSQLELCEEIGDKIGSTLPLIVLGHSALALKDYEQARGYYQRCKEISRATGFLYSFQTSSKYLGKVDLSLNNLDAAETNLRECLAGTVDMGFLRDEINLIYEFARLRAAQEDIEEAVELLGFVINHPISDQSRLLEGRIKDSARVLLRDLEPRTDREKFQLSIKQGEVLDLENIVAELIEENN